MIISLMILIWGVLLYHVIRMIRKGICSRTYLFDLAFSAWLGGLVTHELVRLIIFEWKGL